MRALHTPGPWVACDDDSMDGCDFIPIETEQPTGPLCRIICEVRPEDTDDGLTDVDSANARLIAAAPELLEALGLVWDAYGFDPSIDSGIWQTVQSAIAKATGAA